MMIKTLFIAALVCLCSASVVPGAKRLTRKQTNYENTIVDNVLRHAPRDARLVGFSSNGPITTERLVGSLIDNATLIRENIVGGFDCGGRVYGYYADPANDCQIFHLCVNLKQIFPELFGVDDIMHFSFMCPKYTIFTQDAMVCAWKRSAIPCEVAPQLYYLNNNFFIIPPKDVEKIPVEPEDAGVVVEVPIPVVG